MKITSLFISSDGPATDVVQTFCEERNITCIRKSLIAFEPVPFEIKEKFDVVFFTSPRSFTFFESNYLIPPTLPLTCIGEGTKKFIESKGYQVSFAGLRAGDPASVGRDFKQWLKNRKVLIPQSDKSNKSIEKELDNRQVIPVCVYQTIFRPQPIPEVEIYIFTSPTNFESFILTNSFPEQYRIISWGKTTAQCIEKHGFKNFNTLSYSTYFELIEYLTNLCNSKI